MCFFIGVRLHEDQAALLKAALRGAQRVEPIGQGAPAATDSQVFIVTASGCSCSLYMLEQPENARQERIAQRLRRYRRLGWSQAKIHRAMRQCVEHEQAAEQRNPTFIGLHPQIRAALVELVDRTGPIQLMVKWMSGPVSFEELAAPVSVELVAADRDSICVQPGTAYRLVPPRSASGQR